jgi:hypothetical protein
VAAQARSDGKPSRPRAHNNDVADLHRASFAPRDERIQQSARSRRLVLATIHRIVTNAAPLSN